MTGDEPRGAGSYQVLNAILAAHAKTRHPANALVVWTEVGRALAGMLDRLGAPPGLLRRIVAEHGRGTTDVDEVVLARWIPHVPSDERLRADELGAVMRDVSEALATAAAGAFEAEGEPDRKALFLEVVRGWYPLGVDIFRRFPAAASASPAEVVGALTAWCERYLPADPGGPADLGVRVDRRG